MPVSTSAVIEISAFSWVPPFARGVVRDLRPRWALEEAGLPYRERLLDAKTPRPEDYLAEQPFGQVPAFIRGDVHMFESAAIVIHIAQGVEALMPSEAEGRARAMSWVLAAVNSVEPAITELAFIDLFSGEAAWAKERRPDVESRVRARLGQLSDHLGPRDFLEGRFTVGDLMMTTVLRNLRQTDLVGEYSNLAAYQARCEARPAFQRALAAQLAAFETTPEPA